jgi:hypothetical protein
MKSVVLERKMKVFYGTEEWVTYTFITLSNSAKRKQLHKCPRLRNQPTLYVSIVNQQKKTKTRFKSKEYSTTRPLEIVHTYLFGPTTTKGLKGEKYFMLLIDDYTRMTVV